MKTLDPLSFVEITNRNEFKAFLSSPVRITLRRPSPPPESVGTDSRTLGTLRYEDGKARTGTAVDAGNCRGSRCVVKNKMLKMHIFSKDGDVNNLNFVKAIPFTETVTSFRL